jgi:phytoene synthase
MLANYKAKSMQPAVNVLAHHGKSFRFAGRFLDKQQLEDCARLYRFCRFIDDLVDEASDADTAMNQLEALKESLDKGYSADPIVQDFIELTKQCQMQARVVSELIKGIESDLAPVLLQSESQLLRYCYRVAGTVGLLMCDVFGVRDTNARNHAIDLGIGMQLTNIARDVKEDATIGRRYIPSGWIGEVSPEALATPRQKPLRAINESVEMLLALADKYYASGNQGLRFLPARAQAGITIAAGVYREIGVVLSERGFDIHSGRAHVGLLRKIRVALRSTLSNPCSQLYEPHDPSLHIHLAGLPNAHEPA